MTGTTGWLTAMAGMPALVAVAAIAHYRSILASTMCAFTAAAMPRGARLALTGTPEAAR